MVNPVVSGLSATSIAPMAVEPERPVVLPEASRRVAAITSSTDPNNATQGSNTSNAGNPSNGLEKAVKLVNDNMRAWSTGMRFDIDPGSQRVVISITDSKTGEVLRTIPTDAVLRVAKMIVQLQEKPINTKA